MPATRGMAPAPASLGQGVQALKAEGTNPELSTVAGKGQQGLCPPHSEAPQRAIPSCALCMGSGSLGPCCAAQPPAWCSPWVNGILELINSPLVGFSIALNPTLQPLLPCCPSMSCRCCPRFPEHRLQRHQEATASRGRSPAISTWTSGFNASFP